MVYDYIKENGIYESKVYPYKGEPMKCKYDLDKKLKQHNLIKGYVFVRQGIKNLVLAAALGPIVVVSYASNLFKSYVDGVYQGQGCRNDRDPNHTSLVYGYNFNTPQPYFLFKNNWGAEWGDEGFYKVEIGDLTDDNMGKCLIANTPYNTMPIV